MNNNDTHSFPVHYYGSRQMYQPSYQKIGMEINSKMNANNNSYSERFSEKDNRGDIETPDMVIIFDGGDINGWESLVENT